MNQVLDKQYPTLHVILAKQGDHACHGGARKLESSGNISEEADCGELFKPLISSRMTEHINIYESADCTKLSVNNVASKDIAIVSNSSKCSEINDCITSRFKLLDCTKPGQATECLEHNANVFYNTIVPNIMIILMVS